VIPIVGPELAVLGEIPGQPTLYQHLSKELAARLSVPVERLRPAFDLLEVTSLYLQDLPIRRTTSTTRRARFSPSDLGLPRNLSANSRPLHTSTCSCRLRSILS
jgi:hypothetical protein